MAVKAIWSPLELFHPLLGIDSHSSYVQLHVFEIDFVVVFVPPSEKQELRFDFAVYECFIHKFILDLEGNAVLRIDSKLYGEFPTVFISENR